MAFRHKKESVLKTKDLSKLVGWYLKSKFLPGVTANWTRHPNIPVSCLAKKNNSCHPDRKYSQLESLKQRGSRICNLTSFFCACGYNLDLLMSALSSSLECQKRQAIPIRNIQSMTRLCTIAPICYTSCQKSPIPLQCMQSGPVTRRRKTYVPPSSSSPNQSTTKKV